MRDFEPLTDKQTRTVHFAADIIKGNIAIPCTGCAYCTVKCPQNIAIPQYFDLYNKKKQGIDTAQMYQTLAAEYGTPADCIGCGQCEDICPQHLPVHDLLGQMAE